MKINRIGAISLLMSLLAGCSLMLPAQQSDALLWKISGNGLKAPSYLFGTIHMLCPEDLRVTPPIQKAIDATDQIVSELDFDDPDLLPAMQQNMRLPAELSPDSLYSEKEWALLDSFLTQRMGSGMAQLGSIKPFFLSSFLIPGMLACQPASWELRLAEIAREQEKEVLGLETLEEQLAVVDGMGYHAQADMLIQTVEQYEQMQAMLGHMVEAYLREDVGTLFDGSETFMGADYADFEQNFLITRNQNWIPRIGILAREKATFFAVGAGHLAGEQGVIKLLRQVGYTLTPMSVNSDQEAVIRGQ